MIAPGFAGVEAQLWLWMIAMIRPGAAFLAAPIFGAAAVPVQLRIILSLAIGMAALNSVPITIPTGGVASIAGVAMIMGEVLSGLALGFALQLGYGAAFVAGELIANTMGLGFASMVDPLSGASSTVVGQFLSMLATALFLAANGHLLLIEIIVDSYQALPPGNAYPSFDAIGGIIRFGSLMFAAGLTIALPVGFVLILVQMIMGVIGRSAPAMNLFAVGLPATLLAGVVLLGMATPAMAEAIARFLSDALDMARLIAAGR
jgi:flagellar biosynthetic protein FliR